MTRTLISIAAVVALMLSMTGCSSDGVAADKANGQGVQGSRGSRHPRRGRPTRSAATCSPCTAAPPRSKRRPMPRSSPRWAARCARIFVEEGDRVKRRPGAGAARRPAAASAGRADPRGARQERARFQSPGRTARQGPGVRRRLRRTSSTISTTSAPPTTWRACKLSYSDDPRALRRRGVRAPHQGRPGDRRSERSCSASPTPLPLKASVFVPERELGTPQTRTVGNHRGGRASRASLSSIVKLVSPTVDAATATFKVTLEVDDPKG